MKIKAEVTPYSSVVGGGVTLVNEAGAVIGQLHLLGFTTDPAKPMLFGEPYKDAYLAFCERIARAINAGQAERQVTHTKKGSTYDVVAGEAPFQVSNPSEGLFNASGPPKARVVFDGDPVTVYRNREGMHFVRFPDEMVSPRFEDVPT